ncbi:MAG TPA: hypothetical protein VK994_00035, partial [Bacteroidales bacterium]|nr:hypothetical protein [Bacteroidales bacterium]
GGDFAMYIMQAGNIIEGVSQSQTHYIYNPDNAVLGPPAYPIGFPLLLCPVYAIAGKSIFAFSLLISAFLFGTGMMMANYLRRYFSDLIVFFLVVIMIYNPWTLNMKLEVMSEFAFTFFMLLAVWLYEKFEDGPVAVSFLPAIVGGILISIRTIGLVFPIAVIIMAVINGRWRAGKLGHRGTLVFVIISVGSLVAYYLLNRIIFIVPQAEGGSYAGIWGQEAMNVTILANLAYYIEQLKYFFGPWGGSWNFLPLALKAIIFTFIIIGMIKRFARIQFMEVLLIVYLIVLLIYPYRSAGIRFLFPIMPFLMVFLVSGLETVNLFPAVSKAAKTLVLGLLVMLSYFNMYYYIWNDRGKVIPGPQEQASIEAFDYIRANTDSEAVFIFSKPRVLALYTDRNSLANDKEDSGADIEKLIDEFGVDYVLLHKDISDDAIIAWYSTKGGQGKAIWSNSKFTLIEL